MKKIFKSNMNVSNNIASFNPVSPRMQSVYALGDILFSPKLLFAFAVFALALFGISEIAFANPLLDNEITSGVMDFIGDVSPVLGVVGVAGGAARCGYCIFRRSQCDEMDAKKWTDGAKIAAVCGGLAGVVGFGLPAILNAYFGI